MNENIVIIRPGALGDVLVLRGAINYLRRAFPQANITLIVPGERGILFRQAGWVDAVSDWDKAEYATLFTEHPKEKLFEGCTRLISFMESARPGLEKATLGATRLFAPARPDETLPTPIGEWLLAKVWQVFPHAERGEIDAQSCLTVRIPMPTIESGKTENGNKSIVIHPGSGSRQKNWPLENYAALANMLLNARKGTAILTITFGEADADLGERLHALVPGSTLHPQGSIPDLARLIANAALYIGNDSGVSHLASLVASESGSKPRSAVIFGNSNAAQWSPPEALILDAGSDMQKLPAEQAFSRIAPLLS